MSNTTEESVDVEVTEEPEVEVEEASTTQQSNGSGKGMLGAAYFLAFMTFLATVGLIILVVWGVTSGIFNATPNKGFVESILGG